MHFLLLSYRYLVPAELFQMFFNNAISNKINNQKLLSKI